MVCKVDIRMEMSILEMEFLVFRSDPLIDAFDIMIKQINIWHPNRSNSIPTPNKLDRNWLLRSEPLIPFSQVNNRFLPRWIP